MKRSVLVFILAAASLQAFAQGTAMDFIRADRNPATIAAAGAGYASLNMGTAFAAFGNPAAVSLADHTFDAEGSFALAPFGSGNSMNYGGGASFRIGRFGVSAAYIGSSYPEVPMYSDGGGASGRFAPSDMTVGLGLSMAFGEHVSVGALARYASAPLDGKTTLSSVSADVMAMCRFGALSVSAGAAGLGPKVASISNKSYPLPASARLGAAYRLEISDFSFDFAADGDYYFSGNISAAAGVQAGFRDMVFLRTGYRYSGMGEDFSAAPVPSNFSVGAGFKLFGVSLDLAYVVTTNAIVAGLGYSF